MALQVNAARGEVAVRIGDVEVAIAVTMEGLSRVSAATGYPGLSELCRRLVATEPATTRAALHAFVFAGEDAEGRTLRRDRAAAAAIAAYRLAHAGALAEAFAAALAPLFADAAPDDGSEPDPGNGKSVQGRPTAH